MFSLLRGINGTIVRIPTPSSGVTAVAIAAEGGEATGTGPNDVPLASTVPVRGFMRLTGTAGPPMIPDLAGISGGTEGATVTLIAQAGSSVRLKHQNVTASTVDRMILNIGGTDVACSAAQLVYDSFAARWRLVSAS
jgi:hypothetical protein